MQSLSIVSRVSRLPSPSPSLTPVCNRRLMFLPARARLLPCRSDILPALSSGGSYPKIRSYVDSDSSKLRFEDQQAEWNFEVQSPSMAPPRTVSRLSLSDQAFFLLAFIACTMTVAFTSLVVAAVPTLSVSFQALGKAAISLSKLADTAREELPSTMAAVRLSGIEFSDLTMELSDLSKEIVDGVNKSAQAVQAADAGIRRIGALALQQTTSIIQERASLPDISIQPVVVGAAKKTSHVVGQATKSLINMISGRELSTEDGDEANIHRSEF
ncbi:hypothetical protein SAY86_014720 [Trapa natans]|uniref:Uncharacterized protein n=1 Tax=Trapa natans TaxID=22666 RepID=A0AAN7QGI8_TRANT|nr:hypothetical protein SAY86_014720 [Trapa natans]